MERLEELIVRWEEDMLSEAEIDELCELLQDEGNRWKLYDHLHTSQTIAAYFQAEGRPMTVADPDEMAEAVTGMIAKDAGKPARKMRSKTVRRAKHRTRTMQAVGPPNRKGPILLLTAAAAAVVLVVIAAIGMKLIVPSTTSKTGVATIALAEGNTTILRDGSRLVAEPGMDLFTSDTVVTDRGKAKVVFKDGSAATAGWDSQIHISLATGSDKATYVSRGRVTFVVQKQRGGVFQVDTPHSRTTVLGTQFSVNVRPASTRCDVSEGQVRFEKMSGTASVGALILKANQYAIAGDGIKFEVLPPQTKPVDGGTQPKSRTVAVTGFTLINASTDRAIRPLRDGDQVSLSKDGRKLGVRADTTHLVGSVAFSLNGVKQIVGKGHGGVEDFEPFSLTGDTDGDYNVWSPKPGKYTIRAVPYGGTGGKGGVGKAAEITITVVR